MDELYRHVDTTLNAMEKQGDETELVSPDTEDDLGLIFSDKYQDNLRYVAIMGKWLLWDGKVWKQDQMLEVFDLIRKLCRKHFSDEEALRKRFLNAGTVSAIERLVRSDIAHRATVDQWDSDDWILNTPTGIVGLKAGNLQPHEPNLHCTKITAAGPDGDCPIFQNFLNDVTNGDQDLTDFIQRVMGYACTGSTREACLVFLLRYGC